MSCRNSILAPDSKQHNLSRIFSHLNKTWGIESGLRSSLDIQSEPRSFVGVLQTSDILGSPDLRIGNVNVLSNGGRLQPGCYSDENNITECNFKIISMEILIIKYIMHNYFF